ncbi:MAG: hypothetical protein ACK5CE_03455 [Actinomycetes bacterium]
MSVPQPPADVATSEQAPTRPEQRQGCMSCGSPTARSWSTPDGPARLCPPCATLHGLGCP